MNLGTDQIDSSYSVGTVRGPSAWMGELSSAGVNPDPAISGEQRDYSF